MNWMSPRRLRNVFSDENLHDDSGEDDRLDEIDHLEVYNGNSVTKNLSNCAFNSHFDGCNDNILLQHNDNDKSSLEYSSPYSNVSIYDTPPDVNSFPEVENIVVEMNTWFDTMVSEYHRDVHRNISDHDIEHSSSDSDGTINDSNNIETKLFRDLENATTEMHTWFDAMVSDFDNSNS
jgi:hypothetical protein